MTKWRKQSGAIIELNDEKATVAKAKELGWKKARAKRGNNKPSGESDSAGAATTEQRGSNTSD